MKPLYDKLKISLLTATLIHFSACKKFIEVPPPSDQVISETVFEDDGTATAAITGIYSQMMSTSSQFSSASLTIYAGMSADEIYNFSSGADDQFSKNQLTPLNGTLLSSFWQPAYKYIYTANLCIEHLSKAQALTPSVMKTLLGEAKFIRAFCYFNLVNLFGPVPLVLSSDYRINGSLPASDEKKIFDQVISDLQEAKNLLPLSYTSTDKIRPNSLTASALLARAYLYRGKWADAEAEASNVIGSGKYSLASDLRSVFTKTSPETIWQLQPVSPNFNTWEGNLVLPFSATSTPTYLLTANLVNTFENGDRRKTAWDTVRVFSGQSLHVPYKYKVYSGAQVSEYYVVLRLAEQYLIRAEARAQLNKTGDALADINVIRNRAGLTASTAGDLPSLLLAIEKERATELFAEWGQRWFDLKRTGRATLVLGTIKPTWQATDTLWPIPQSQININPTLKQNPGY